MNVTLLSATFQNSPFTASPTYVFQEEISKGTHSKVFLGQAPNGEKVAIKRYCIESKETLEVLAHSQISPKTFIERLAFIEKEVGALVDHPNIVKIRDVWTEGECAFVAMDFVEGTRFDSTTPYTPDQRLRYLKQLLSAIEHMLLRNVLVDDLWAGNLLITPDDRLILIDLGGNCLLTEESDVSLSEHMGKIQFMLEQIAGPSLALKAKLPESIQEEVVSTRNVRVLVAWIEALQKELKEKTEKLGLSSTKYLTSPDDILSVHGSLQQSHPDTISFSFAQPSKFLAYTLFAEAMLDQFHPGYTPEAHLRGYHFVRYPFSTSPRNVEELFNTYPVVEDYDTASQTVANALVSISPSLKEKETDESAWSIFMTNDRNGPVKTFIGTMFKTEKVAEAHFSKPLAKLMKEKPKSPQGLLYTYFFPRSAPLEKALYVSEAYGIPKGDPLSKEGVKNFYTRYEAGQDSPTEAQLRFLPAAITPENGFDLSRIKSYRMTTLSPEELSGFAEKVESTVKSIYQAHLQEMLALADLAAKTEALPEDQRESGYQKLLASHLKRFDLKLARYYFDKLSETSPLKPHFRAALIAYYLSEQEEKAALKLFYAKEAKLPHEDQLLARFALYYLERGDLSRLKETIYLLNDSPLSSCVKMMAASRYEEYKDPSLDGDFSLFLKDEQLIPTI